MLSFAVVIPNLNQSQFLGTALESLRYQAVPFELAIMDGGSTDNFSEVVEKYSDIITYLRSERDEGQAAAIREGKDIISGDIVAWLNADDYYFPCALEKVAACFEEDPELDVVYGDAVHVSPDGCFLSYFCGIQEFNEKDLTRSCYICQPACFVRRSAYESVGGIDPTLQYTMDWDLWCRLSSSGAKFKYIHELLAAVRCYPETKTLSNNWLRYKEIWRIERKYGHRLLPLSWPGFYFYDLTFKTEKTMTEKAYFYILNLLRHLKKGIIRIRNFGKGDRQTIYGFHRWDNVVQGNCTIFLPWYDKRQWSKLRIKIKPPHNRYHIQINGEPCWYKESEQGFLVADVPALKAPCREISIQCPEKAKWRLLGFSCELVKNDPD
jgi:glycosyltransferase involved in cell wall biosynthesis